MLRKRFYVKIELQLHAITCPGVWLCTQGYLEATLKTLGYYFRTGAMEPRFPLLCHDQFTMEGYFKSVCSLEELERVLGAEQLELTLWQNGRRLAHFLGQLGDVMQSNAMPKLSCYHNVNVQLLMQPTPAFPGIIAPKVEMNAKVAVHDRLLTGCRGLGGSLSVASSKIGQRRCSNGMAASHRECASQTGAEGSVGGCQHLPTDEESLLSYAPDKRRQRPVCHASAASNGCLRGGSGGGGKDLEIGNNKWKNEMRRVSTCSSHFSNISNTLSQTTTMSCSNSKCSHSLDTQDDVLKVPRMDEHQRNCALCQKYKKVFAAHKIINF